MLWKSVEMSHGSPRWSGAGPLVGTDVEWIIQAVDGAGNIGITANKAVGKSVLPPEPVGDIHAEVTSGTLHASGWYTTDVGVTISGAPGIEYSLDRATFTPGTSVAISGTGVHSLDFQGSDGSHGSISVPIDVSNPTVTVNATYGFGQVAHAVCADSGSGIASCSSPIRSTRARPGRRPSPRTPRIERVMSSTPTLTYNVLPFAITGFFSPIENLPAVNVVNAGSSRSHQVRPLRLPRAQRVRSGLPRLAAEDVLLRRPDGPCCADYAPRPAHI